MKERKTLEIKQILKDNKDVLANRFKVKKIGIFGSYVRDEQTKKSDGFDLGDNIFTRNLSFKTPSVLIEYMNKFFKRDITYF